MADEKVRTDWDSMRTADPKVFAAGDARVRARRRS